MINRQFAQPVGNFVLKNGFHGTQHLQGNGIGKGRLGNTQWYDFNGVSFVSRHLTTQRMSTNKDTYELIHKLKDDAHKNPLCECGTRFDEAVRLIEEEGAFVGNDSRKTINEQFKLRLQTSKHLSLALLWARLKPDMDADDIKELTSRYKKALVDRDYALATEIKRYVPELADKTRSLADRMLGVELTKQNIRNAARLHKELGASVVEFQKKIYSLFDTAASIGNPHEARTLIELGAKYTQEKLDQGLEQALKQKKVIHAHLWKELGAKLTKAAKVSTEEMLLEAVDRGKAFDASQIYELGIFKDSEDLSEGLRNSLTNYSRTDTLGWLKLGARLTRKAYNALDKKLESQVSVGDPANIEELFNALGVTDLSHYLSKGLENAINSDNPDLAMVWIKKHMAPVTDKAMQLNNRKVENLLANKTTDSLEFQTRHELADIMRKRQ